METIKTIKTLAEKLKTVKDVKQRDDGKKIITFDYEKLGELGEHLQNCVRLAHLDELPNDFAHSIVDDVLDYIIGENIETLEQFNDNGCYYESIENSIPTYNNELVEWLGGNLYRAEYLTEYSERTAFTPESLNLFDLIRLACGEHIQQIYDKLAQELSELAEDQNNETENTEEITA